MGGVFTIAAIPFKSPSFVESSIIKASALGADIVEFRLDYWQGDLPDFEPLVELAKTYGLSVLITVRDPSEGGRKVPWKEEALKIANELGCLCDVEARLYNTLPCKKTILSVHYFDMIKDRDYEEIKELSLKARNLGAYVFKVAAVLRDLNSLLKLRDSILHPRKAFMPMGRGTERLRLLTPLLGSMFIYGSLGDSTAPGQVPLEDAVIASRLAAKYRMPMSDTPQSDR
ncbi:3-dehydroquinate dehydratase [Ignicoccus pacificus DSM 13166]|uniref:3-dehydroquinate dehydratase n=1 Tax=Ignicoccus pacificus DSM 13166 TaxID=940294 RepID=A0A977PKM8_9CREN|nr:3-dehydroquinate dehydratase [Ignicoccus pacificus DSM 13166]